MNYYMRITKFAIRLIQNIRLSIIYTESHKFMLTSYLNRHIGNFLDKELYMIKNFMARGISN